MAVFTEEVVRICNEQWEFFDRGRRKEYQKKVFRRIGDFWSRARMFPAAPGARRSTSAISTATIRK